MNEDFVSFNLAKKLKEKGFNQPCLAHYTNGKFEYNIAYFEEVTLYDLYENWSNGAGCFVDAPTISQVLKWLREEKKIHVIIATFVDQLNRCYTWGYEIWNISEFPKHIQHVSVKINFTGHDKAAIAGIEFVIDNLI